MLTDLSLADYTLLRRAGYRPVGVVTSTSSSTSCPTWRPAARNAPGIVAAATRSCTDFTQGVYAARERALGRATRRPRGSAPAA